MDKSVLVHSCFSSESVGAVSIKMGGKTSEKIFVNFPNANCRCQKHITRHQRNERLAHGELYVILRHNSASLQVPEWNEVVETGKEDRCPRGATIEKAHIERAYVSDSPTQREEEQKRIEAYNTVNQQALATLGAIPIRVRGKLTPPIPRELTMRLPEEPCTTHWGDQRTGNATGI
jgi:hypothetical protein